MNARGRRVTTDHVTENLCIYSDEYLEKMVQKYFRMKLCHEHLFCCLCFVYTKSDYYCLKVEKLFFQ